MHRSSIVAVHPEDEITQCETSKMESRELDQYAVQIRHRPGKDSLLPDLLPSLRRFDPQWIFLLTLFDIEMFGTRLSYPAPSASSLHMNSNVATFGRRPLVEHWSINSYNKSMEQ